MWHKFCGLQLGAYFKMNAQLHLVPYNSRRCFIEFWKIVGLEILAHNGAEQKDHIIALSAPWNPLLCCPHYHEILCAPWWQDSVDRSHGVFCHIGRSVPSKENDVVVCNVNYLN
jgi:hypothetical protein